jgi:hypothetical protein
MHAHSLLKVGNAPNLDAGIGGGTEGAARETTEGHGLCGDFFGSRRGFMAGGEYGSGPARGSFEAGGTMKVTVKLTAYHAGHFEFRLCVPSDGGASKSVPITQDCLNQHVLTIHTDTPGYPAVVDYEGMKGISNEADAGGFYKCKYSGGHFDPTSKTPNTVWPSGSCCNDGGACSPPDANTDRFHSLSSLLTYEK